MFEPMTAEEITKVEAAIREADPDGLYSHTEQRLLATIRRYQEAMRAVAVYCDERANAGARGDWDGCAWELRNALGEWE